MWIDIGKLIREHIPDKNGKALPADLTSGSYEIRDLTNKFIGALFEGKVIYDKTYGHVSYGCGSCCGFKLSPLWYDPLGVPFLGTSGNGMNSLDTCSGLWEDVSDSTYGNWSTANTGIATVDYYATHTGRSIGSTTSSTFAMLLAASRKPTCPVQYFGGSGGTNVQPCATPATETTAVQGIEATTFTQFVQTVFDTAGDNFNGQTVEEGNAASGQDTCWFQGSTVDKYTGMTGGSWTVDGGQVSGQPNAWGFDVVGWSAAAITYYRAQAPAHGIAIPCGLTGYQSMQIQCHNGTWWTYTPSVGNKLTATIEQTDVINCRYDMNNSACQTINY